MVKNKRAATAYFDEISAERVEKAAKMEGRSLSNFMQWASIVRANTILGKADCIEELGDDEEE